ncbi:PTS lactose/cellobiose transporter subunit IIA [Clostridium sp. SYSU_GA19001]|uniref:PTS lactose/cellobiose transporter subunit IIA n=1 Tax=Clostridium caldaquaticum TaxID=2940653 RepID=UPI0020778A37|nr:PTS lactose/cellobiose transporter subunit IIA [Clostridium caldaquaticum]MCM8709851.1 PTS lactose/cellobiose transporter subunit IIA [Clostridium caldaquaticum]
MDMEAIVFEIIGCAGTAKSLVFEAIGEAKEGNFDEAEKLLGDAKAELLKAHDVQNDLIFQESSGNDIPMKLLLVHAEDHLMAAILAKDLGEEMINLYKLNRVK